MKLQNIKYKKKTLNSSKEQNVNFYFEQWLTKFTQTKLVIEITK